MTYKVLSFLIIFWNSDKKYYLGSKDCTDKELDPNPPTDIFTPAAFSKDAASCLAAELRQAVSVAGLEQGLRVAGREGGSSASKCFATPS